MRILHRDSLVYYDDIPFENTFGRVQRGMPLAYFNSLMNLSIALNMDSFSKRYGIESGPSWKLELRKKPDSVVH